MRSKKAMIGFTVAAALAVLGLAIFLITQPPAARDEATGAIGAAQRYRAEQIKEGDTGVTGDAGAPGAPVSTQELAEVLGRAASGLRAEAFNQATLEQQASMWENATELEKANSFLRLSPEAQRAIMEKMGQAERIGFEKLVTERAAAGKAASDLGRVPADLRVDALNKAALENKADMFGKLDTLGKLGGYLRLSPDVQRAVAERMNAGERLALERVQSERVVAERLAAERAAQERLSDSLGRAASGLRAEAFNQATLEQQASMWENATELEKANSFLRLSPEAQRAIMEKMGQAERIGFEKLVTERAAAGKAASDLGRVPADLRVDALNKAALENKADMFGKLDTLGKLGGYLRLSPDVQRAVAERMNAGERLALERVQSERVAAERVSAERAAAARVMSERAASGRADQQ
jgi:vacuolar protein sorting-associated protein 54